MKKLFLLMFVMILASGLALAQSNIIGITQVGGSNSQTPDQSGASSSTLTITQVGNPGQTPSNNNVFATQVGGPNNLAWVDQSADNGQSNLIETLGIAPGIVQNGSGNQLVSTSFTGVINPAASAIQTGSSNLLLSNQQGNTNLTGLYQDGNGTNSANIDQLNSLNELAVNQEPGIFVPTSNTLIADQAGTDLALVTQSGGGANYAEINQDGDNKLVYADINADLTYTLPASQNNLDAFNNTLDVTQAGTGNEAGLNQFSSTNYNWALIKQPGGGNSLGVYQDADSSNDVDIIQNGSGVIEFSQTSTGGLNYLFIRQSFGSSAIVDQTATVGDNTATINQ